MLENYEEQLILRPTSFNNGEYIIKQGSNDKLFYLIEEGSVMLTIKNDLHDPYEMEKQIGRKNETEILGEVAFLRNCTRTCS